LAFGYWPLAFGQAWPLPSCHWRPCETPLIAKVKYIKLPTRNRGCSESSAKKQKPEAKPKSQKQKKAEKKKYNCQEFPRPAWQALNKI